jgi:hypothetical protein
VVTYQEKKKMLFDLCILLQKARLHERPGTKQSNMIRSSIRGLRESLIARQTGQTTDAQPATSEVSCNLALSLLLASDDDGPF